MHNRPLSNFCTTAGISKGNKQHKPAYKPLNRLRALNSGINNFCQSRKVRSDHVGTVISAWSCFGASFLLSHMSHSTENL
uniref:Uncharacterized protein n=1 Tax=Romanomermis culicivorax TaxID=13658 RepID=A0A915J9G7_ROMCU